MEGKINWGILGYARIAKLSVIPAILETENSHLYALVSSNEEKRRECQDSFPFAKIYDQYEQLLDDPQVHAVYIPLPNSMHKEWAIKAMRKGKHVLCEKPIALSAEECLEMMQVAQEEKVLLMEAFMYRYTDQIKKVQEILETGEIGEIKFINSVFRFFLNRTNTIKEKPELGGGSLYDVGCYPVNFIGMITKELPESCVAEAVMDHGVDMMFSAVLKYPSGLLATIHSGFNAFNQMNSEIVGTKGRIEVTDTFLGNEGVIKVVTDSGSRFIPVEPSNRYALEIADFTDAILNQGQPLLDLEESYRNMQVIDMLIRSLNDRQTT
ncbi:Gfo/Idh/MocA family protein [Ammoniphilus sp. YIM 78166]|uniref:Gfo/Idh/MocA family protein n=1 Tax=Ammoniphilus sp. YIM 78166 TaxID=1644106 RepID=UPI00106F6D31|nr:Gfo/Idh/MocA family oxidoreductase [Ammoniphilus sp. YIM 78166]